VSGRAEYDDTNPAHLAIISQITRAAKSMPDDFFVVPAVQQLAATMAQIESRLSIDEMSDLLAIGAVLANAGKAETTAGIQAALAIRGIKPVRHP